MTGNSNTGWPRGRGYGAGHWFKRSVTSAGGAVHCFPKKLAKSSAFSVWFDTACPSFVMSGIGSAGVVIRASAFAFLHNALASIGQCFQFVLLPLHEGCFGFS